MLFDPLSLAIPDDAPVLEESDNEEDMESDRRISSTCTLLVENAHSQKSEESSFSQVLLFCVLANSY